MKTNSRFITLALTSVTIPASTTGHFGETQQIVGAAMLIAERPTDADHWAFQLKWNIIPAGSSEEVLLLWLTHALPENGTLIGWQLGDDVIDPLLDAASENNPEMARRFLNRLMKLATDASVDLAIAHGGENAPSLHDACRKHEIVINAVPATQIESAWALGDLDVLRDDVRARLVAAWQLWLAQSNGAADAVNRSFTAWLTR